MPQPGLKSDKGVVATVGLMVGVDRAALVIPMATDDLSVSKENLCEQALDALKVTFTDASFLKLLATSCHLTYIQCEGMDDGQYPARIDYPTNAHPGTGGAIGPPASVGALVTFYAEFADLAANERMKHSRMTIPGIPASYLSGAILTAEAQGFYNTFANQMLDGFRGTDPGGPIWYRVLSAPQPVTKGGLPATDLVRIGRVVLRWYPGTVKRRVLPHS